MAAIAAIGSQPICWILAEVRFGIWRLFPWSESTEYIGEGLVFIGVLLEVLCERKLILKRDEPRRDRLEGIGSWMLILGLAVSLAALIGTNKNFNKTIADLNLKAAQANDRAAANEKDAAAAEGKLRQLQVFALARHISDPDALVDGLKPIRGRQAILRSYVGDAEGWLLCVSLSELLHKAQIGVTNQCGRWPFSAGKPVTGLVVSDPDSRVVETILTALVDKGYITGSATGTNDAPPPLLIFVGIKNPFWLPEQALTEPRQQKSKSTAQTNGKTIAKL